LFVLGNAERAFAGANGSAGSTGKAFRYSNVTAVSPSAPTSGAEESMAQESVSGAQLFAQVAASTARRSIGEALLICSLSVSVSARPATCYRCELFHCVDNCPLTFTSLSAFDAHYTSCHVFRCEACGLQLPNNRLLEMHVAERHDEFFRVMARTRGKMFACLVEGCPQKSNTRKGRQPHLVAIHSYPPNFTYDRRIHSMPHSTKGKRSARHKDKPQKREDAGMSDANFVSFGSNGARSPAAAAAAFSSLGSAASSPAPAEHAAAAPSATRPPVVSRSSILSFKPRSVTRPVAAATAPATAKAAAIRAALLPSYDASRVWAPPTVAATSASTPAVSTAPPPVASPQFTTMRDSNAMDDDDDGDADHAGQPPPTAAGSAPGDGVEDALQKQLQRGTTAATKQRAAAANHHETLLRLPGDDDDNGEQANGDAAAATTTGAEVEDVDMQTGISRLRVAHASLPKKTSFGSLHRRHA
jgi:hypothetical protein